MNLLLDTHLLLWSAAYDDLMSPTADKMIKNPDHTLWFSVTSIWEVAIKRGLNKPEFKTDPGVLRAGLLNNGYQELAVEGRHCLQLASLPMLHGDPFDRMLIAQAMSEGMTLLTSDKQVAKYTGPIKKV
ncbi:MAG: type II toxin-antitoxin system VapC family toxin [Paracoccaceae bacterium]